MSARQASPASVAAEIRRALKDGGSASHAKGVQWFFKEEIKSHGWYTADLRRVAGLSRRGMAQKQGMEFVVSVADKLYSSRNLEEKVFVVFLLEKQTKLFGDQEFKLFASWLDRITNWADHDALVHHLIAPMVADKTARTEQVFAWAKSASRWRRRAACVALIRGAREKRFFQAIVRLSGLLLKDQDDMVQKGLGWLLRETAKYDPTKTVPYLMKIRDRAPRLVLRTACETLSPTVRKRILA